MADEYDYDMDGFLDDDGWMYVEDGFDLADELAEGQIADPGYISTSLQIAFESEEFDLYGYYEDLEYGDDAYWDAGSGQKRKWPVKSDAAVDKKRRKVIASIMEGEPLVFHSQEKRYRAWTKEAPISKEKPFAFLGDWRERFAKVDGIVSVQQMPSEMKIAAEAQDDATPRKAGGSRPDDFMDDGGEEDWEDEDGDGDVAIDPELMKSILREKLRGTPLEDLDEEALMETLEKIMSGEDGGGEIASALTDSVLAKAMQGDDNAASAWLSQQGVSLGDEDLDEDADSNVEAPHASHTKTRERRPQESSPDNAVSMSSQMPMQPGSLGGASRKRHAASEDMSRKSGKKVKIDGAAETYEVNRAASQDDSQLAADGTGATNYRKRKATVADADEGSASKKQTWNRELQELGPLPKAPSPAPPAKRTRSTKAKSAH